MFYKRFLANSKLLYSFLFIYWIEPLSATILSVLWLNVTFGLPELIGAICIITTVITLSISNETDTQIIYISATTTDPQKNKKIVDKVIIIEYNDNCSRG